MREKEQIKKKYAKVYEDNDPDYTNTKSSGSTGVADINGFIFGGVNSRFWLLRKHFNSLNKIELQNAAFHSWECLSLQMAHRDVDVVIKDLYQMNMLLKFLIHSLRTIDGYRGTADPVLEVLNKQSTMEYLKKNNRDRVSESVRLRLIQTNEHYLFRKVYIKFLIMRVRAKISFMALSKRMTIVELFASTI